MWLLPLGVFNYLEQEGKMLSESVYSDKISPWMPQSCEHNDKTLALSYCSLLSSQCFDASPTVSCTAKTLRLIQIELNWTSCNVKVTEKEILMQDAYKDTLYANLLSSSIITLHGLLSLIQGSSYCPLSKGTKSALQRINHTWIFTHNSLKDVPAGVHSVFCVSE